MQINKAEIPERRKQRGKQTGKKKAEKKEAKLGKVGGILEN